MTSETTAPTSDTTPAAPAPPEPPTPFHDLERYVALPRVGGLTLSPMPGLVRAVEVVAGQAVAQGDRLAVLEAMKRYGLVLADNGSPWYFQGTSDKRWPEGLIEELKEIPASAFEAVDTSYELVVAKLPRSQRPPSSSSSSS